MAQIIPSGYVSTVIHIASGAFTDGEALITMGNHIPGDGGASDAAVAVANAMVSAGIEAQLANETLIPLVECFTATTEGAATTVIEGDLSGPLVPPQVCLLVEKRSALRGRRAQGRNFWPHMLVEDNVDDSGNVLTARLTALQTFFDDFWEALDTSGAFPVILQGEEGISSPISPPPPVTRFVVDPLVSTQRRRLRR
jgi:hypothetical protein